MIRRSLLALSVTTALAACGGQDTLPAASTPVPVRVGGTCDETAYSPKQGTHFVHPSQNFYAPGARDAPNKDDVQHLLLYDNAVVVSYPARASRAVQDLLADWASKQVAAVVVPDSASTAAPLRAFIATAELHCDGVNLAQLSAFADKRPAGATTPHADEG